MQVKDKVVVITGASEGIGLSTARRFAAEGAKVVLAARSADKLEQIAQDLREEGYTASAIPTDMRDEKQVKAMVDAALQKYGQIDVLINNAGQSAIGKIAELNIDNYRKIIELNLFGVIYAMQAVIPTMREHGGGIIANVSSMVSKMQIPTIGAYASTKAALNMLSATANGELSADNIRVLVIYPRITTTNFGKNALGTDQARQQRDQQWQRPNPNVVIDTPEYTAEKILQAVVNETPEQYMDA